MRYLIERQIIMITEESTDSPVSDKLIYTVLISTDSVTVQSLSGTYQECKEYADKIKKEVFRHEHPNSNSSTAKNPFIELEITEEITNEAGVVAVIHRVVNVRPDKIDYIRIEPISSDGSSEDSQDPPNFLDTSLGEGLE